MPVLPAVPSTSVSPGLILPARSADSIIDRPMRSLIEPPGLALSSLKNSSHGPASRRCACTIGVLPISSSTLWCIGMKSPALPPRGRTAGEQLYRREANRSACDQPTCAALRRPRMNSMYGLISLPHDDELVLGAEFFLLHIMQGGVVHRQHAQFGVAYLAIALLVSLIQSAKLHIALDQHFDIFLLVLEHQPTSSAKSTRANAPRSAIAEVAHIKGMSFWDGATERPFTA